MASALPPEDRPPPPAGARPRAGRRIWWWLAGGMAGLALLLGVGIGVWSAGAIYNRLVRFPREAAAWQALRAQREPVPTDAGWHEFRGVLHAHSELSHDSDVPFPEILAAMQAAGLDFIGLSDHPHADGRAIVDAQWRGLRGGRLFLPGFEMRDGLMPLGVAPGIVLSNRTAPAELARQVARHGGLLFFAHPENPRQWDLPELAGMEIYNLHTDYKRLGGGITGTLRTYLPDLLLNLRRYPDHVYRLPFRRPTEFLARWDELNRTRHLTGIAGNDCHQNVGLRAHYTPEGTVRVEDTSPKVLREFRLNWFTRPLVRLCFGPLKPGRVLFHVQLDPYERSARFVNTHVLARELSEPEVMGALRAGRVFVAFDMIADSSGFRWFARDDGRATSMGETHRLTSATRLHVHAPIPCRFTLVHNGRSVGHQEGRSATWTPAGPGKYRVEAELRVGAEWVPWVYANPIELR